MRDFLDQLCKGIDKHSEADQIQHLNEISFVLYEGLKRDFDK